MRFRTVTDIRPTSCPIDRDTSIVTLGSCFSAAIGGRLEQSGFNIAVNPMGVLFNPVTIARAVELALAGYRFSEEDLFLNEADGTWHALQFESRRQGRDPQELLDGLNADFKAFSDRLKAADVWIVTLGTAWSFHHKPTDSVAGNCHKLPDSQFERRLADTEQIVRMWTPLVKAAKRVIFTVSPVRHLNNGLHGNTLSKAILHLAVERLCSLNNCCEYFPAYEALMDDLRDYRFYADDLKHPTAMAEEYIYNLFCETYLTEQEFRRAEETRRRARALNHRPIL